MSCFQTAERPHVCSRASLEPGLEGQESLSSWLVLCRFHSFLPSLGGVGSQAAQMAPIGVWLNDTGSIQMKGPQAARQLLVFSGETVSRWTPG